MKHVARPFNTTATAAAMPGTTTTTHVAAACTALLTLMAMPQAMAQTPTSAPAPVATPTPNHAAATTLGTVTVTGLPAADLATPIQVIEGRDWQLRRESSLGSSLAGELGMQASHFGTTSSRPVVRGMDGARVGILSNGMALHDASTFSPDHAVDVNTLQAQSVEILRGPAALVHEGAIGGVINVVDRKIATEPLAHPIEADAALAWHSNDHARHSSLGLSTTTGPLVLRVEAAEQDASASQAGGHWMSEAHSRTVPGSSATQRSGALGVSWVGSSGYLGAAYTRQSRNYGLPVHAHSDCHPHGHHLHCGGHSSHGNEQHNDEHDDEHDDHNHDLGHGTPRIRMHSHRWDVRGEWRPSHARIQALRLQASHTRYAHDELEAGSVNTAFRNQAHALRLELQHAPIASWRGQVALSHSQRDFSAVGAEAYVPPTDTEKNSISLLETRTVGAWRWQAALRHDQQTVTAHTQHQRRQHHATSAALGAVWHMPMGWHMHATLSRAARLPSAEELFANGAHLATSSWEVGNAQLRPEVSRGVELGVRNTQGRTTWQVQAYRNTIDGYIYQRTVDAEHDFLLQHTTQGDARFTGFEAQVRYALQSHWGLTLFADSVRAQLRQGGGALPRIPAGRWGLRTDVQWHGWQGLAEWVQTRSQQRVSGFETATDGFGVLNVGASYQAPGSRLQWQVKANNLSDRLGYAHTSAIKQAAPLMGRQLSVGLRWSL